MKVRIHRGAHEVGGNCVEVEAAGSRILLDLGRPLSARGDEDTALPDVAGLRAGDDSSLAGIVLSHAHLDHYGLIPKVEADVPVFMGEAAHRMLVEATFFTPSGLAARPAAFLRHRERFEIGPFAITPFLNDHSAFDAYSLLVEADGRALFYTGDIRGHGRKAAIFEELLRRPPARVDALLMEGTHVRPDAGPDERGQTEDDVEAAMAETFRGAAGVALVLFSPQNIDRLVSVYRAARKSGREIVLDLYAATIAAATGRDTIPRAGSDGVRVYLPLDQKMKVVRAQAFERIEAVRGCRIFREEIRDRRGELVVLFRQSMARDLDARGCLDGACAVWSMWPGYLEEPSGRGLLSFFETRGIPVKVHHASGHAFIPDLVRLAEALRPGRIVPIHSFGGDSFARFFPRIDRQPDGTWWEV